MNCLTRLLALGVLSLGAIGQGAALAALPSTLSTPPEAGDRDRFEVSLIEQEDVSQCVVISSMEDGQAPLYKSRREAVSNRTGYIFENDDLVEILEEFSDGPNTGWVKVRYAYDEDVEGFIPSRFIGNDQSCPPTAAIFNTPNVQCYAVINELNIYDNPGREHTKSPFTLESEEMILVDTRPEVSFDPNSDGLQWGRLIEPYEGWIELQSSFDEGSNVFSLRLDNCDDLIDE